ncbi:acyltransferase family protein [Pseudoduganella violacea]|uniref:Peptidoglycan/LPS O-acetylase OafA/YrhL n=1 Tax=Pseudoduganella violacea TaxID=1715466 RepID=A0A7W5B870_9BURK|nr:acyltransferase [Pseudoduganella violacea]MBB3118347.1 peptidoglycan/LPS O-acetylase OafA/YrhL [Pseudoduganella violacea]
MKKDYTNEIDLLRFLAAIAVVFFHWGFLGYADGTIAMSYDVLGRASQYGYLGVQLFFIISGFVIIMSAGNATVASFTIARIIRLYPAYWLCCTLSFIAILSFDQTKFSASLSTYLYNMTMLEGFLSKPFIDHSYWTLTVEIRFYFLVALVILLGQIRKAELFVLGWLAAIIALEFYPVAFLAKHLMQKFAPYFIAGTLFYFIRANGLSARRIAALVVSWAMAVRASLSQANELSAQNSISYDPVIVGVVISIFFVVMFLVAIRKTGRLGSMKWTLLGSLTYPLYLIHQTVGFLIFNALYPAVNRHLLFWGTLAGALCFAYLVTTYVEQRYASRLRSVLTMAWVPFDSRLQALGQKLRNVA